jgi:hydrogenase maturation factor
MVTNCRKLKICGYVLKTLRSHTLVKRQKLDDRNAQINGIYVINPNEDAPGAAVNSQNGLMYYWYYYREIAKKYRAFDMGAPTDANIKDYIEDMIKRIPENERKEQGLEIQLSDRWMKAYRKRAGELYQLNFNTDSGQYEYKESYPVDYPNFRFQVLKDMTKTDFIGITQSKNVQIMDYDVSEKGKFTVTHDRRDTNIFADYRLGIRFLMVGNKLAAGEPNEFEVQKLWSNNVPVFGPDVSVPVFDDASGIMKVVYPNMVIDEKWKTDVTQIEGDFVPGQVIKITGNTALAGIKNLKDNASFDLQGDYPLNTAGYILLYVNEDKTLKELERTTVAPVAASTDVSFTTAAVDAKEGSVFRFTGNATKAVDTIINGVENKSIKIYGTDAANVDVTFSTTGNIKMVSNATLGKKEDYVQLTLVAGLWRETKRVITA